MFHVRDLQAGDTIREGMFGREVTIETIFPVSHSDNYFVRDSSGMSAVLDSHFPVDLVRCAN